MVDRLPVNLDAERMILGAILLDDSQFHQTAGRVQPDDFSLAANRKVFRSMTAIVGRGQAIDRITVAEELSQQGELKEIGGLTYLVSLDDGMPVCPDLDGYCRILRDKAVLRRTIFAAQKLMAECLDSELDPAQIIANAQATLTTLSDQQSKKADWMNPGEIMESHVEGIPGFLAAPKGGGGLLTPWKALNNLLCGLQRGELVVFGGRPSAGKSVCMSQMAHYAAREGEGAAIISLEMKKETLIQRTLVGIANVDFQRMRSGFLDSGERSRLLRAAAEIKDLPLYIEDSGARTIATVQSALRRLAAKKPIRIFFIDHLSLMQSGNSKRNQNLADEVGEITHAIKHLAMDLNATAVLLSQLSRESVRQGKVRKPELTDLRNSGDIEQDADSVLFIHREEMFNRDPSLKGKADLIVAKQRNGPVGEIPLYFKHSFQKFLETAEENDVDVRSYLEHRQRTGR